eukprot:714883-Amphidinium_carterae.2
MSFWSGQHILIQDSFAYFNSVSILLLSTRECTLQTACNSAVSAQLARSFPCGGMLGRSASGAGGGGCSATKVASSRLGFIDAEKTYCVSCEVHMSMALLFLQVKLSLENPDPTAVVQA